MLLANSCGNILREQRVTSYQELLICQSHRYILSLPLKLHVVQRSDVFPHLPPIRPAQVASVFVVDTPRILLLPIIQAGFLDVPRATHGMPSWWYLRDFETFLRRIRSRLKKNDASVCDSLQLVPVNGATWPHSTKFNWVLSKRTSSKLIHQGWTPFPNSSPGYHPGGCGCFSRWGDLRGALDFGLVLLRCVPPLTGWSFLRRTGWVMTWVCLKTYLKQFQTWKQFDDYKPLYLYVYIYIYMYIYICRENVFGRPNAFAD